MTVGHDYIGDELELFAQAENWKAYLRAQLTPHLRGDVLEIGAGLGGTTRMLCPGAHGVHSWTALEPDTSMHGELSAVLKSQESVERTQLLSGTLAKLDEDRGFDTALYVDVLEHIEDDRGELLLAARHLRAGGRLCVMSPAHNALFSEFDRAIGHHRRYNRDSLLDLCPPGMRLRSVRYLDAVGLSASLANRLLLRAAMPTLRQVLLWDRRMVPLSRRLDRLLGYRLGKSILAVWEKAA